jgi:hypothetical protein
MASTRTIQVGTTVLELSQIVVLLEQIEQVSDSARKKLTEQKASFSKNQEAVQSELNAFRSISKFGIVLLATEFSGFYWPYGHQEVLAKGYVDRVEIVCRDETIAGLASGDAVSRSNTNASQKRSAARRISHGFRRYSEATVDPDRLIVVDVHAP